MNPTAVDFGPVSVYGSSMQSVATDFGDGLYEACGSPSGWYPEVESQPTNGSVEFTGVSGWRWSLPVMPSLPASDSFTYRLTDGTNVSNVATISAEFGSID